VINNVDDVLLISVAVTCDQHSSAVEPVTHIVLRLSDECPIKRWSLSVRRPYSGATRDTNRSQIFPSAFSTVRYSVDCQQIVQSTRPRVCFSGYRLHYDRKYI